MKFEKENQNEAIERTEIVFWGRYNYLKESLPKEFIAPNESVYSLPIVELISAEYEQQLKAFFSGLKVMENSNVAYFACDLLVASSRIWEVYFFFHLFENYSSHSYFQSFKPAFKNTLTKFDQMVELEDCKILLNKLIRHPTIIEEVISDNNSSFIDAIESMKKNKGKIFVLYLNNSIEMLLHFFFIR